MGDVAPGNVVVNRWDHTPAPDSGNRHPPPSGIVAFVALCAFIGWLAA